MTAPALERAGFAIRWNGRVARVRFKVRNLGYRVTDRSGYRREQ